MAKKKQKQVDVKFINSLAMSVTDVNGDIRHLQITIVQEIESKAFRCYFDVVDPHGVKITEE